MIIITGASKGIGKYLREKYLDQGEKVYGTYFSTKPLDTEKEGLTKVNISDEFSVNEWIESISDSLENIILINCAGINYNSYGHKSDYGQWSKVINVNLLGTFNVIKSILPIMRNQNFGRIINLSSVVAQMPIPGTSAYAASKSGLWGMTRSLAIENARKGITINSLTLGYFDIGMISEVPENFQDELKEKIPTHAFGNPENIFRSIEYIRESDYLNGSSININGCLY